MQTPAQRALSRGFVALSAALPGGLIFRDEPVAGLVDFRPIDRQTGAPIPSFKNRQATAVRILKSFVPEVGEYFEDAEGRKHRIKSVRISGEWADCECEVSPS